MVKARNSHSRHQSPNEAVSTLASLNMQNDQIKGGTLIEWGCVHSASDECNRTCNAVSVRENNKKNHDNKNYTSSSLSAQFPSSTAGNLPNLPTGKVGVIVFLVSQSHLSLPFSSWLIFPPSIHHIKYSKQART